MGNSKKELGRLASVFIGGAVGTAVAFILSGCEMQHAFDRLIPNPNQAGDQVAIGAPAVMPVPAMAPEVTVADAPPAVVYPDAAPSDSMSDATVPPYSRPPCHSSGMGAVSPEVKAYREYCSRMGANRNSQVIEADETSVVRNVNGSVLVNADGLGLLDSARGNIQVMGIDQDDGSKANLKEVQNTAGSLLICNMNVERIINFNRGNFTVVGGSVGVVDGFRGNLTVVDGEILSQPKALVGQVRRVR